MITGKSHPLQESLLLRSGRLWEARCVKNSFRFRPVWEARHWRASSILGLCVPLVSPYDRIRNPPGSSHRAGAMTAGQQVSL